jgi:hypothetical protein
MRISTRVGRRSSISMGPVGWLIFGWIVLPAVVCWWTLVALVWLAVWTVQAISGMVTSARR